MTIHSSALTKSTRCEIHRADPANWYCSGCFKSLCERCTKVGVIGRVCLNCKIRVQEISSLGFERVATIRQKDLEEQRLAKAMVARQQQRQEKERLERETRLKARMEARKSERPDLMSHPAEQETVRPPKLAAESVPDVVVQTASPMLFRAENPAMAKDLEALLKEEIENEKVVRQSRLKPTALTRRSPLPPVLRESIPQPEVSAAPAQRPWELPQTEEHAIPMDAPLEPPAAVAHGMYNPFAPNPANERADDDPMLKLGERADLKAIWNSASLMLLAGILMCVSYYTTSYILSDEERESSKATVELRSKNIERIRQKLSATAIPSEKEILEQELIQAMAVNMSNTPQQSNFWVLKIMYYGSIALGVILIVLSFGCERFPLHATALAFAMVLASNVAVLFIRIDIIETICRWSILVPLYLGMAAGFRLRRFRFAYRQR